MAYPYYQQMNYQPNYYNQPNPYYQQMQQQQAVMQQQQAQAQQQQQMQQPAIQQSGFVLVQSEQEARAYPVAPGNSITFKDERQPYCYVKTMGFNQLDRPTFERYRLVKEDMPTEATESATTAQTQQKKVSVDYALKADLEAVWAEIDALKEKKKKKQSKPKKTTEQEAVDDE